MLGKSTHVTVYRFLILYGWLVTTDRIGGIADIVEVPNCNQQIAL